MKSAYKNDFDMHEYWRDRLIRMGLAVALFVVLLWLRCCSLREARQPVGAGTGS